MTATPSFKKHCIDRLADIETELQILRNQIANYQPPGNAGPGAQLLTTLDDEAIEELLSLQGFTRLVRRSL